MSKAFEYNNGWAGSDAYALRVFRNDDDGEKYTINVPGTSFSGLYSRESEYVTVDAETALLRVFDLFSTEDLIELFPEYLRAIADSTTFDQLLVNLGSWQGHQESNGG